MLPFIWTKITAVYSIFLSEWKSWVANWIAHRSEDRLQTTYQHGSPDYTDQYKEQAYSIAEFGHLSLLLPWFVCSSVQNSITFDKVQACIYVFQLEKVSKHQSQEELLVLKIRQIRSPFWLKNQIKGLLLKIFPPWCYWTFSHQVKIDSYAIRPCCKPDLQILSSLF